MLSSLDRRLENVYIASNIEVTEAAINIPFDSAWISNLNSNKRLGIKMIAADIDANSGYPFRLEVDRKVLQGGMTYIDATQIDINLTVQRMSDIGQIITDRIKESFDIDLSFNYENTYGYLFISGTMDANTSLRF
jgi:hypothetical protein